MDTDISSHDGCERDDSKIFILFVCIANLFFYD